MVQVLNFPFPTAPDRDALAAAERTLRALGALDADGALTERGRAMAALPLDPRPSRMILQVFMSSLTPLTVGGLPHVPHLTIHCILEQRQLLSFTSACVCSSIFSASAVSLACESDSKMCKFALRYRCK